jgi:hypothetical protein
MFFTGAPYGTTDPQGLNFVGKCGAAYQFGQDQGGTGNWGFGQKIVLIDLVPDQRFGNAVALDGEYAIAGHRGDFSDAMVQNHLIEAGSAWILKNVNGQWKPIKKLVPDIRAQSDMFRYSVAISGNTAVVGAPSVDEDAGGGNIIYNSGAAYVFRMDAGGNDNWGLVKKLVAADRAANDQFGTSVAIDGSTIMVGAPYDDEDPAGGNYKADAGSVYIFLRDEGGTNNWGQFKKVVPMDRTAGDYFGWSLAIHSNQLVSGAPYHDEGGNSAGAAYVFSKDQGGVNTWGQVKKLYAPDRYSIDYFGTSVAINGSLIAVGSHYDDEDNEGNYFKSNAGSAYLFSKDQGGINNWGFIKKLVAPDRQAGDVFGYTLAVYDTTVVVGSPFSGLDAAGAGALSRAGAAYIFTKNHLGAGKWGMVQKITAADRDLLDYFSYGGIAMNAHAIIIGAYNEDEDMYGQNGLYNAGSVYYFKHGCESYMMAFNNTMVVRNQEAQATKYFDNNCALLATLTPSSGSPIGGAVTARVWIEPNQPSNYVRRHYELVPYQNASTSAAIATLYFSQADFDAFNAVNAIKLPAGTADNAGKANLLIEKRGGFSNDGSGAPNTYTGNVETINPADNDIVWNAADNRWEVSFNVTGFSGFFVKTTSNPLPICWLQVQGRVNPNGCAELTWKVEEKDAMYYSVERSATGMSFGSIGNISSQGDGMHHYRFVESMVLKGSAYYRIMQKDKQGRSSYSSVVKLGMGEIQSVFVSPNPTSNRLSINVPESLVHSRVMVSTVHGIKVMNVLLTSTTTFADLGGLANGIYLLHFANGDVERIMKQ